ncbi:MAG: 50S ribosomal protein L11 methyltransferase [Anaerolineae bacterium]|nr:50S ribosomal protein L11 methyltransferase [Anaerolineae bacterium]
MKWLEASVAVDSEAAEAVAEVLARIAPRGVAMEAGPEGIGAGPVTVRAYLPVDEHIRAVRRQVEEALWHLGQIVPVPEPTFCPIEEQDWAEAWKKNLCVLHVGRRIVVRPSWLPHEPRAGEILVELDPGMAFGTGSHPTTQLCLMALEDYARPGMRLLDLGTGSGILAIAAAKMGVESVLAVDKDPQAVVVARENARRNAVAERITVVEGSLERVEGHFDLVLANIIAKVIVELAQQGIARHLAPGGVLAVSGLLAGQEEEIAAALGQAGLEITASKQVDDWALLAARHTVDPD